MRLNSLRPLRGRGLSGAPKKSGALGCSLVSLVVNPALDYEKFVKQFYSKIYEILGWAFCIFPTFFV